MSSIPEGTHRLVSLAEGEVVATLITVVSRAIAIKVATAAMLDHTRARGHSIAGSSLQSSASTWGWAAARSGRQGQTDTWCHSNSQLTHARSNPLTGPTHGIQAMGPEG